MSNSKFKPVLEDESINVLYSTRKWFRTILRREIPCLPRGSPQPSHDGTERGLSVAKGGWSWEAMVRGAEGGDKGTGRDARQGNKGGRGCWRRKSTQESPMTKLLHFCRSITSVQLTCHYSRKAATPAPGKVARRSNLAASGRLTLPNAALEF